VETIEQIIIKTPNPKCRPHPSCPSPARHPRRLCQVIPLKTMDQLTIKISNLTCYPHPSCPRPTRHPRSLCQVIPLKTIDQLTIKTPNLTCYPHPSCPRPARHPCGLCQVRPEYHRPINYKDTKPYMSSSSLLSSPCPPSLWPLLGHSYENQRPNKYKDTKCRLYWCFNSL
jgi:hypothetical protein